MREFWSSARNVLGAGYTGVHLVKIYQCDECMWYMYFSQCTIWLNVKVKWHKMSFFSQKIDLQVWKLEWLSIIKSWTQIQDFTINYAILPSLASISIKWSEQPRSSDVTTHF